MTPTKMKSAPVEMPWLTICKMAPLTPVVFMLKMPSMTKPRWLTEL